MLYVSDHGYKLGEHGAWEKHDLFEEDSRTDAIMVLPPALRAQLGVTLAPGTTLQALASLTGADIQALAGEHLTKATDACCLPQPDAVDFYQEHYHTYQRAAAHVEALYREGRPL